MALRIVSYVMSGGIGSRLWPLSREDRPKQFHALAGEETMLARTLRRAASGSYRGAPVVVIAASQHASSVRDAFATLEGVTNGAIFEPMGRNTAAAVAMATMHTLDNFGDLLVLVMPSDHEISTDEDFWTSVRGGAEAAEAGKLVVFGIPPTRPEVGFGYIEAAEKSDGVVDVSAFREKPDLQTARDYVESGKFFWNAGIFLFRASAMKAAFEELRPDIWTAVEAAYAAGERSGQEIHLTPETYAKVPSTSVDYAIMEKAGNIAMAPARFAWSDLGSWESIYQHSAGDSTGNVTVGDVVSVDNKNCYLRSEGPLLATVDLEGLTVVATRDAVFVAPTAQSQNVKKIFERLDSLQRPEIKRTPSPFPVVTTEQAKRWLFDQALPRWAKHGVDVDHGGFHEALDLLGESLRKPKRIRTMARQVYVFANAAKLGWNGSGRSLADHGLDFLVKHARTDDGGWVRTVEVDGEVSDPVVDSYDLACVLLALAAASEVGNKKALTLADETLAFMDARLADKRHGGYLEDTTGAEIRRSNPHMHLLEAFLALYRVTGEAAHLHRAGRIVDLFVSKFFDPVTWTVGEYFDANWRRAGGAAGDVMEPGHHYEWVALLLDYAKQAGRTDLIAPARQIYVTASALGTNVGTGLAYATATREGAAIDVVARTWPQTEALKAAIALADAGQDGFAAQIGKRVGLLFERHIWPAPTGMWIDRIDAQGKPIATEVPASILYHVMMALDAYIDFKPRPHL